MTPLALLIHDLRSRLGWRLWALILLFSLTGLAEGTSVVAILPLLSVLGVGSSENQTAISAAHDRISMVFFELPPDPLIISFFVACVFTTSSLLLLAQGRLSAGLYADYGAQWRTELLDAFLRARWGFFVRARSGELVNGMTAEVLRASGALHQFTILAGSAIGGLVYLLVAFSLSWRITLAVSVAGALVFLLTRPLVRRSHRTGDRISTANEALQSSSAQTIGAAKTIKAMGAETQAKTEVGKTIAELRTCNFHALFDGQMVRAVFEFGGSISLLLILLFGIHAFALKPEVVLVVMALFVRLFPRISSLQQSLQSIAILAPSVAALRRLLEAARSHAESTDSGQLPATVTAGPVRLALKDVNVVHGPQSVLRQINLRVEPGEIVAIVGGSGAGKSTLVDTILGLTEIQSGELLIAGVPLAELPVGAWRRHVGYMAQDAVIFNASAYDNISWGKPTLGSAQIKEAIRRAALNQVFSNSSRTLETIGDGGSQLSGGERQRIALARALAGDPLLLVLDEATSALDSQTETQVMAAVAALRGKVTVLMVAHRMSACRIADKVVVIEEGRIVDSGTPDELLQRSYFFRHLAEAG